MIYVPLSFSISTILFCNICIWYNMWLHVSMPWIERTWVSKNTIRWEWQARHNQSIQRFIGRVKIWEIKMLIGVKASSEFEIVDVSWLVNWRIFLIIHNAPLWVMTFHDLKFLFNKVFPIKSGSLQALKTKSLRQLNRYVIVLLKNLFV